VNSLDDIFGDLGGGSVPAPVAAAFPAMLIYDKDEFRITFDLEKSSVVGQVVIHLKATNLSAISNVTDFVLQAAVPKSMQLELSPPSSTIVPVAGGLVTQLLKVNNPSKATLKMRLKLNYNRAGILHQDQMEINDFPAAILH
jgi:AP-1 complex subunit gamma-1